MLTNSQKNVEKKKWYLPQKKTEGKNYGIYRWTFHKVALLVQRHKFLISTLKIRGKGETNSVATDKVQQRS